MAAKSKIENISFFSLASPSQDKSITFYKLGYKEYVEGNYAKAIKLYDASIQENPKFAKAHKNRGYTKYKMGQYKEAAKDLDAAIKHNPNFDQAYNAMGLVKLELGQRDAAKKDFEKALEINPNNSKAARNIQQMSSAISRYSR